MTTRLAGIFVAVSMVAALAACGGPRPSDAADRAAVFSMLQRQRALLGWPAAKNPGQAQQLARRLAANYALYAASPGPGAAGPSFTPPGWHAIVLFPPARNFSSTPPAEFAMKVLAMLAGSTGRGGEALLRAREVSVGVATLPRKERGLPSASYVYHGRARCQRCTADRLVVFLFSAKKEAAK